MLFCEMDQELQPIKVEILKVTPVTKLPPFTLFALGNLSRFTQNISNGFSSPATLLSF